jgi:hypothetical protein
MRGPRGSSALRAPVAACCCSGSCPSSGGGVRSGHAPAPAHRHHRAAPQRARAASARRSARRARRAPRRRPHAARLAIARPVLVLRDQSSDEKGIDIVVVMDLSGSMRAVLDAIPATCPASRSPPPGKRLTRLDTAKVVIRDFVSRRDRPHRRRRLRQGAYVLSPPTLDYHLLTQMVVEADARRHRRQRHGDRRRASAPRSRACARATRSRR